MRFVVAGASGFLGSALVHHLREGGHEVTRLVRREAAAPDESAWDPDSGHVDSSVIESADVVVNVAGSPLIGNVHSEGWASRVRASRVGTTRLLAEAIAAADGRPAYLAQNGISYYGDHGDDLVTEDSDSRGDALLTSVAKEWQAATEPASAAGARVCVLRTAPVMDKAAPPLQQMRLAWRAGLGARLGDGRQRDPMISLRDWLGATTFLAESPTASGVFNLCCPQTPTNAEFTHALAAALHRKAFLRAPGKLIEVATGRMGPELLGSTNARPAALEAAGYQFRDRDVETVLAAGLA